MKLKFKSKNFNRKGDTTYCTIICMLELSNTDVRMENTLPKKYQTEHTDYNKVFEDYVFNESNYSGLVYKAVSIGKAEKSATDEDNPRLARKLAEARARLSCYRYAAALHNAWFHYLKELAFGNLLVSTNCPECTSNGGMYDQWLYYQNLVEREKYHISKLLSQL